MCNDHKVEPLHKMPPKTSTYVKSYDGQIKWMYFLIENDDLLEKYNTIWDKVSADIKKEFDSEPACNKSLLKTKIKSDGDEVTDFYNEEIPKVDSNSVCENRHNLLINIEKTLNRPITKFYNGNDINVIATEL